MLDGKWFTEIFEESGSAFSLQITDKLYEEQTPYQKIEIFDTTHFGKLMSIDGCVMLSSRDNFIYHEMMSHPALLSCATPEEVLIIGGGDCGTLKEVLKHKAVTHAVQVDIDEGVTRASENYFPELCTSNNDPRAELHFDDGIAWVKNAPAESIDVIIVDSTDPVGPAEGLFTLDFFSDCYRVLRPGGIVIQQSGSPLVCPNEIIDMHKVIRDAGFDSQQTYQFPQCVYPSGWWSATAGGKGIDLSNAVNKVPATLDFDTLFYSIAGHHGAMAIPPFLQALLEDSRKH